MARKEIFVSELSEGERFWYNEKLYILLSKGGKTVIVCEADGKPSSITMNSLTKVEISE